MVQAALLGKREATDWPAARDPAVSRFVTSVGHELRTPLTSIVGYVELLAAGDMGEVTGEQRQVLDRIGRNAQRLCTLVEDVLRL